MSKCKTSPGNVVWEAVTESGTKTFNDFTADEHRFTTEFWLKKNLMEDIF